MGKNFVYNSGEEEIKKDELQLTFGVFIDGTLNNKDNTDMRSKYARGATGNAEDGYTNIDYSKSNKQIEEEDEKEYDKIKNKKRIKELLAKRDKTPQEKAEFDAIPEKHKYLVGSHRTGFGEEVVYDKLGTDNSYSNDYTNVARMWNYCEKKKYRIYVEGMGTDKLARDSQDGFAFGGGFSGVRSRVRNACEQIALKVKEEKGKRSKDTILTKITLDVFGFSRGAASARNFVHEVNVKASYSAEEKDIPDGFNNVDTGGQAGTVKVPKYRKALVDADDMEVEKEYLENLSIMPVSGHLAYSIIKNTDITPDEFLFIDIVVRFIGAYETVSSYWEDGKLGKYDDYGKQKEGGGKIASEGALNLIGMSHLGSDIEKLNLNNMGVFHKLIHFTAKDEHRKNFSLTPINQIVGRAIEKKFPGVHCDIGGAYETEEEYVDEIETSNHLPGPLLNSRKEELIDEGWFKDEKQLEINNTFLNVITFGGYYRKLSGTRLVKKEYSYIPLHFMEEYARTTPMDAYFIESMKDKYPIDAFLKDVSDRLHEYVFDGAEEWNYTSDKELAERKKKKEEEKQKKQEQEEQRENHSTDGFEDGFAGGGYSGGGVGGYYGEDKTIAPITIVEPGTKVTQLEEVVVTPKNYHKILKTLRNEYLHWSANRDWLGMQPNNTKRERTIHT